MVGDVRGIVLSDGHLVLQPVSSVLVGSEDVQKSAGALLQESFLPTERLEAQLNTVVLIAGKEVVLVDVGAGKSFGPTGGRQAEVLANTGLKPEHVTKIFITHAHGDHLGGYLNDQGQPVYPNAELILSEKEHAFWNQEEAPVAALQDMMDGARKCFAAAKDRLRLIKPGAEIASGITAVEAYGHTPGHCQLLVASGKDSLLITGDTANHPILFLRHPEWAFGFDFERDQAAATRKKTLEAAARDRTCILAYHFPFPGIGHIRTHGSGGYEYVAEPMML
jgi:glyoxylase-like metal-dependent hydrolase (beta-lactamase superfamily II)